ncbi:MAG: hypothetical protein ACOY3Y_04425 [Acidobacteriota bacterium]
MKWLFVLGLALALAVAGCSNGEGQQSVEVWIDSLSADDVVSGDVEVQVGYEGPVARIEILVGDAVVGSVDVTDGAESASVAWNSVETPDGAATVTARASTSAGRATDGEPVSVVVDNTAPVASLDLARLSVLQGTVEVPISVDEANLTGLRLLSGDDELLSASEATSSVSWDTTAGEVGVHRVSLEVTDAAGHVTSTDPIPVVVANGGEEIDIEYSPSGWIIIPADFDGTQDTHTRVVAPMSDRPVERVISWLTWEASEGWLIEYAIGQGICPHRGVQYLAEESREGEIILDLKWTDLDPSIQARALANSPGSPDDATTFPYNADPLTCGSFFGHAADMEPADHAGMELQVDSHFVFIYAAE